jgi:hypothetical protein
MERKIKMITAARRSFWSSLGLLDGAFMEDRLGKSRTGNNSEAMT